MFRRGGWFGGGLWKPKNPHSLEHLKYLYHLLSKNQTVTEQNKGLLVETLRSIAEILIWGDQNDSTVFDFFLEKNMLSFFLKIMKQKCGRYVCVQLLQTLNILFENIRNETSLYYLLSNNHVNSIIVHKFDFSDEEVMAYYISFLKTLSLKLNNHTIHFFYNEHTNDFPLYTEAIKFFNHSESMVRIAVRTLTLNVFKVEDKAMLKFIRDKTAAPYFSNLVWFIGNHVLELDQCANSADHSAQTRLSDLVAEHLDHLHYLNDILCLNIDSLNDVLTDHLLNRLFIPLYVYSLIAAPHNTTDSRPRVSNIVSLFLLSQVFLIMSHRPLVYQLAHIILNRDMKIFSRSSDSSSNKSDIIVEPEFVPPEESLEKSLEATSRNYVVTSPLLSPMSNDGDMECLGAGSSEAIVDLARNATTFTRGYSAEGSGDEKMSFSGKNSPERSLSSGASSSGSMHGSDDIDLVGVVVDGGSGSTVAPPVAAGDNSTNITDEEKEAMLQQSQQQFRTDSLKRVSMSPTGMEFSLEGRPFLASIFAAFDCSDGDHSALFALCLLYAVGHNEGITEELLDTVYILAENAPDKSRYNDQLMSALVKIVELSCTYSSKVRLATLEMSIRLIKQLCVVTTPTSTVAPPVVGSSTSSSSIAAYMREEPHLVGVQRAKEACALLLRSFYKSEEIFLDMFEDEYQEVKKLNVEYLMMDARLLLPPMGTPMSGLEFHKRLPCGEVERARRAIRAFFLVRDLCITLAGEQETQLPLTNASTCVKVDQTLDLNNSDLIACTVVQKDGQKIRRFMVIDGSQVILVEPDTKRLGWGIAKFVGFLQDIEVTGDQSDSRSLNIVVHRPASLGGISPAYFGSSSANHSGGGTARTRPPLLSARFIFDDHIRCMAAKQRLTKGRIKARQRKMNQIARLLGIPETQVSSSSLPISRHSSASGNAASSLHRSQSQESPSAHRRRSSTDDGGEPSAMLLPKTRSAHRRYGRNAAGAHNPRGATSSPRPIPSANGVVISRSRDNSPRLPLDEEIPMEDLSGTSQVSPTPPPRHHHHHARVRRLGGDSSGGVPPLKISDDVPITTQPTPTQINSPPVSLMSEGVPSSLPVRICPPVSDQADSGTSSSPTTGAGEPPTPKDCETSFSSSTASTPPPQLPRDCHAQSTNETTDSSPMGKGAIQTV